MSFRGPNTGLSYSSLASGTQLNGTYEIGGLISSGGMGEVYRGHNIATGDPVAIKVVLPEYAADTLILELFRKEARILHQLFHDAIVRYYGFASDRDINRSYMAMEFVEGPSLAARLQQGPLSIADVVGLKTRLADGLQRAHELGIVHRDISPENVILQDGHVSRAKIIDFGIAKSAALAGEGTLIGTTFAGRYNYASPEQVGMFRPQTVSVRSDIYSLGLVLAAALRGSPIDMSGTMAEIMEKRMSVPDLSDVPQETRGLLAAMLEPNPEHRIASMAEVRDWPIVGSDGQQIQPPRPVISQPPLPMSEDRDDRTVLAQTPLPSLKPPPKPAAPVKTPPRLASSRPEISGETPSNRLALWIGAGVATVMFLGAGGGWYYVKSRFPTASGPEVPQANTPAQPETPATPTARPAAKTADTPPASGNAANQSTAAIQPEPADPHPAATAPEPESPVTNKGQPGEPALPPRPESETPQAAPSGAVAPGSLKTAPEMSEFIAAYDGGPCFFAWPRDLKTGAARISVFAFDTAAFEGFYEAFKTASGFDPAINVHKIAQAQCPAIDAIKQLTGSKAPVPALSLVETSLSPGGVLVGESKDMLPNRTLEILRVDEAGRTYRLTGLANGGVFTTKVGQPGTDTSASGPLPQLAIALSSPEPLQALAGLDDRTPAPAAQVFPALLSETSRTGRVSVAAQFFVLRNR